MIRRLLLLIRDLGEVKATAARPMASVAALRALLGESSSPRPLSDRRELYDCKNPLRNDARKHTINARSI